MSFSTFIQSAVIFSFLPVRRHGASVAVLLILSFLSLTIPIEIFSVSKQNQLNFLKTKLEANQMLQDNSVVTQQAFHKLIKSLSPSS